MTTVEANGQSTIESDISDESEMCCKSNSPSRNLKNTLSENESYHISSVTPSKQPNNNYASNKNTAEGLMDIALLSANANQLRFLITYNHDASTYYISITLVALSLVLQILVGIALIFKVR